MTSGAGVARYYRFTSAINLSVALVIAILSATLSGNFAATDARQRLLENAHETLAVQTEILNGLLDRYRLISSLVSHRPETEDIFDTDNAGAARDIARQVASASGAIDVMFLHTDGSLLSAGISLIHDTIEPDSDLVTAALQGRLGRAVRQLDNKSLAYVFTSGVLINEKYSGIIAVYVSLEEIQAAWSLSTNPILASDQSGLIIISNRRDWQQQHLGDIERHAQNTILVGTPTGERRHLKTSHNLPLLGWTLSVLSDASPIDRARRFWAGLAFLTIALIAIGVQTLINRQNEFVRRERHDRATALRLERIVRDRTKDLKHTNTSLQVEVEERKTAEEQLRNTQAEFIQTGKMAALGQMSTALAHEYNQPLSAIKSYAGNALTFLDRQQYDDARENISLISSLTDRMANISGHLRNFARTPSPDFGAITINNVINDAIIVTAPRLRADMAIVNFDNTSEDFVARAGHIRLQQVIVNLVINALDAQELQSKPEVSITTSMLNSKVKITVSDNGPGIPKDILENIFDPFVTTKPVGQGLGLGLSISYNIIKDFGGQLTAQNNKKGGAKFTITLQAGNQKQKAAE